ncbi:hypothetical protein LCGC14_2617840 [marine sediment metagenome]|uniref:Uncharacterized protein n=1 Tax=marine sediment metagenome TaxID=412755 RepID=A0A0F9ARL6_9ZZZZ
MGGSFGNYLEDKILDHILKVAVYTPATNLFIALYTVAPTDVGGGTELSGGGYLRTVCNSWDPSSGGASANAIQVLFPEATGDWGTIVAFAIWDAQSGGNFLKWGDLTQSRAIPDKDSAKFVIGDLQVTLD